MDSGELLSVVYIFTTSKLAVYIRGVCVFKPEGVTEMMAYRIADADDSPYSHLKVFHDREYPF